MVEVCHDAPQVPVLVTVSEKVQVSSAGFVGVALSLQRIFAGDAAKKQALTGSTLRLVVAKLLAKSLSLYCPCVLAWATKVYDPWFAAAGICTEKLAVVPEAATVTSRPAGVRLK